MRQRTIAAARRRVDKAATASSITNVNAASNNNNNSRDDMLWVDKHAPRSFPHLLSDERTNREVLRALRAWDPYVFRKASPLRPLYQRQREQEEKDDKNAKGDGTKKDVKNDPGGVNSADKRPEENARVILLSGPPGVGTYKSILCSEIKREIVD